jgi:hypothetical protein
MGISNDLTGVARNACIMHNFDKSEIVHHVAINSRRTSGPQPGPGDRQVARSDG